MTNSFFFYDLETSGVNPRSARIMQFAGQRTDLELNPIADPVNVLIRLTPDVVPEPDAILITGITPQQTLQDGISEAEFAEQFTSDIATPGTIFAGFNSVRFDDEFMRFFLYRNFHDPYEWQWRDSRSRWDLLDVVRMTRALRPEGITWPFDTSGKPTNRLELLTSLNGLDHEHAHDALNDVLATIAVAKLIRQKQPKLFDYLLTMRDKKAVQALVGSGEPFVYTSGKYPSEYEKTTVAIKLADHPKKQGVFVYDLRHDPSPYLAMSPEALAAAWKYDRARTDPALPVKVLQYNRCPAVAPVSVLDAPSRERLKLDMSVVERHRALLMADGSFLGRLQAAAAMLESAQQTALVPDERTVDAQLYDGFIGDTDRGVSRDLLRADPSEINTYVGRFRDDRLKALVPLYKARNYPKLLSDDERAEWESYCQAQLLSGGQRSRLASFFSRLGELAANDSMPDASRYLLEELQLYGQSIMPAVDEY